MKLVWTDDAWKSYLYWESKDKKTLKKINSLIKKIVRDPNTYRLKAEQLKYYAAETYSLRINHRDRLVFRLITDENKNFISLEIIQCKGHYN